MIVEAKGNLLKAPVEALVNTVNTEGVMGKGIALQFKNAFPPMFKEYAQAAKRGDIQLGSMHVWATHMISGPRFIINFPTKGHWRSKSRLADIDNGLKDLIRVIRELGITSIAVPPLGCGNGGLNWRDVEPHIRAAFDELQSVEVQLFAPVGAPSAADMPVNTRKPQMSAGRAALVGIVDRYTRQALTPPSLIETQKLLYFLQIAGEQLRLEFHPNRYGPYADNLRHVLAKVEGYFLSGYGDGSAKVLDGVPLTTIPGAVELAEGVLAEHPETKARMREVLSLAQGFESAYGLELLATVHWVVHNELAGTSDQAIVQRVAEWSPRKASMFTPSHVENAIRMLREHGLIPQLAGQISPGYAIARSDHEK